MLAVTIDRNQIRRLERAIEGTRKTVAKETKMAVRQAANDTRGIMAKKVTKELNVTQAAVKRDIKKPIVVGTENPRATVRLPHEARLSLKRFKPRQIKAGVSYRLDKRQGVSRAPGAFMGPKPGKPAARLGGHVFKRLGKSRTPIVKLHGASPWGAFKKRRLKPPAKREAAERLQYRLERRIRTVLRKKAGKF